MKIVNKLHSIFHTTLTNKQVLVLMIIVVAYLIFTMIISLSNEDVAVYMSVAFFGGLFLILGIFHLCDYLYKKQKERK